MVKKILEKKEKNQGKKRILVLNLVPNTVGDSIIMLPMFKIIKKNFPDSYLVATGDKITKELWQNNKEIDEIIVVDELEYIGKRGLFKIIKGYYYFKMFFKLIREFRSRKFNICFIAYPNFFLMHLIPFFSGIKERIGFTYKGSIFSFLLTKKTPSKILFDGYYDRHIVESFLDLLRVYGLTFTSKDKIVKREVKKEDIILVKEKLRKMKIHIENKIIISLHTLSKLEVKNWPAIYFKDLIKLLVIEYNPLIFLLGSSKEFSYNEEIRKVAENNVYNLCGIFSLNEVGAILKLSDLFIGNDSGLGHYASAVGTKTISIFGATNPKQAKPIGHGKTEIIFKNIEDNTYAHLKKNDALSAIEAMKKIKPEEVFEVVKNILK
ncbi:MAG: glycosyltransferase family 9 protein [Candidatus Woesearchaeota archaeon]